MAHGARLPEFVPPMLARLGEPFDSSDHFYEVKWDGMRAIALVDAGEYRMYNRQRVPLVAKYPELRFLADLPRGTVLDGELVVTRDGRPDFHLVMTRQHATSPARITALARSTPVTYIVFDLLYEGFTPITSAPLSERRARLAPLVEACRDRRLVLSDGVVGQGRALFEQASARGLEGIVAKRLSSTYAPGKRTDAWIKIKKKETVHCAILGFLPEGQNDFKSLVIAIEEAGALRWVGQVGGGIDAATRAELNELLWARVRPTPAVPCEVQATWVEPGLLCTVTYLERTPTGNLRAPVFGALIRPAGG